MTAATRLAGPVLAACLFGLAPTAAAQQPDDEALADRPLATRTALETLAQRLERTAGARPRRLLERVRARLSDGDFRSGDRIILTVQGESTLTDTFTVAEGVQLALPSPTVGSLPLRGVLRAELEPHVTRFLVRFVQRPVVRAYPTIRLSVQGEVMRAGFYHIPAEAEVTEVLMAAGGTTREANVERVRIERGGQRLWQGKLQQVGAARSDIMPLRDGDQIVVSRRRMGGFEGDLRFLWVVVSLAGGVYGLSRL